jgi:HAMP domain-containing protein
VLSLYRNLSLRLKLITLVTALIFGVAAVLLYYFPLRFEERARGLVTSRAESVTEMLAALDAPTVDLKLAPEDSVKDLSLLSTTQGAIYAVSRTPDGKEFGVWNPKNHAIPSPFSGPGTYFEAGMIHVVATMTKDDGHGGKTTVGSLTVGFSVGELAVEKAAVFRIVAYASLIIVLLGFGVSFLIGTVLVRPIRRMTDVATQIARGELAHADLDMHGRDEVAEMAQAFDRMLSSLRELAGAADRVARGDLTGRLSLEGQVAAAFNRMVDEQQHIVRQIAETSSQLAGAAAEIYAASQEQEAAASQQAGGMEEVRRTMQSLLDAA